MAYNVTLSNGTTIVTIPDGAVFNTYSVPLIGQNTSAYGDDVAAAFLRGLENFAFTQPPDINPNIPGSVKLTGQLWYDTVSAELKIWNGSDWVSLLTAAAGLNDIAGDVVPETDSTYDIGTMALRWAEIWADDIQFGGTLTAEGGSTIVTSGTLTADGSSTVNLAGNNILDGATFTDRLTLAAASGPTASLRIPQGSSTSTTTGDVWLEADGVHVVINGSEETLAIIAPSGGVTSFGPSGSPRSGAVVTEVGDYSSFYTVKDGSSGVQTISASAGWTFNNRPAFNGGTSGVDAPFTVDSTFVVSNLNSDLLDGEEGSFYSEDATVVHVTGNESIAGTKTFTATINADAGAVSGEGLRIRGTSPSATDNLAFISFYESDNSTLVGRVGRIDNSTTSLDVSGHQGNVRIFAADLTSTDPIAEFSTGGVEITNSSGTTLVDIGLPSTGENTALRLRGNDGTLRNAGFNETPEQIVSGTVIINATHVGKFLRRSGSTSATIRLDNALNNYPIGASFMVHNDNSSNTMTVTQNGTTLEWVDGSGSAPLTGTRTIAYNGVATVRKKSTGVYQIWGNGIS